MQVNVLGAERRRRWSYDEKVRLVEETLQAGETVCGVARRHGVAHSLLFTWRRQARQGRRGGDAAPALVPVEITPVAAPIPSAPQPASSPAAQRARGGIIEIELGGGCRVRVDRNVDVEALQRVLERFNWLGFKRLPNGALLCDADSAGWIGALFWLLVLAGVITVALR
jgi:transposase